MYVSESELNLGKQYAFLHSFDKDGNEVSNKKEIKIDFISCGFLVKAMAIETNNSVIVTGQVFGINSSGNVDNALISLKPNGDKAWHKVFGSTINDFKDEVYSLALDKFNNIFLSVIAGPGFEIKIQIATKLTHT